MVNNWTLLYNRINEQVQFELYYMYVYTMDDSVWTRMKTTVDWPVFWK